MRRHIFTHQSHRHRQLPTQAYAHNPVCRCSKAGSDSIRCVGGFSDGSGAPGVTLDVIGYDEQVLVGGKLGDDSSLTFKRPDGEFYVLFDAGRTELKASANRTILKLVQFLQINPRRNIRIEGYTDNRGVSAENLELSRARAQAVADVLVDLGIDARRMQVKGYGEAHPLAENASAKGRAQNRRVEILISDEQGKLGDYR